MESMDWTQPVAKDTVEKKCCEADSGLVENQLDELECVFWTGHRRGAQMPNQLDDTTR